jgi:hypothetical protein
MNRNQVIHLKNKMNSHPHIFINIIYNAFNEGWLNQRIMNLEKVLKGRNDPLTICEINKFKLSMAENWLLFQLDEENNTFKLTENKEHIGNACMKQEELLFLSRRKR